jgi:hypothetical protein
MGVAAISQEGEKMKLTDDNLAVIKSRHEKEDAIYKAVGDTGWGSHQDRGALLDHIEDAGFAARFGAAMGSVLGTVTAWLLGYLLLRWAVKDDVIAVAAWLVSHIRIAP